MKPWVIGIIIFAFLCGGILTIIGAIIRFSNSGDILNLYNEKVHDKDKVSKLVGRDILCTGSGIILVAVFSIFLRDKYYPGILIAQVIIMIAGMALSLYDLYLKCKK